MQRVNLGTHLCTCSLQGCIHTGNMIVLSDHSPFVQLCCALECWQRMQAPAIAPQRDKLQASPISQSKPCIFLTSFMPCRLLPLHCIAAATLCRLNLVFRSSRLSSTCRRPSPSIRNCTSKQWMAPYVDTQYPVYNIGSQVKKG